MMRGLPGLLLAAAAIPAAAQETVTPPTITPAPAPSAAPAPTPAPAPAASPTIEFAPQAPVVQTTPPPSPPPESVRNPASEPGAGRATRRAASPAPRAAPAARAEVAAPAAATAETAPEAAAPIAAPAPAPAPVVEEAAADPAAAAPAPAEAEEVSSGAAWAILGLALAAIVGLIAFLVMRRRRRSDADMFDYDESVANPQPEVAIAPPMVAAAPLVPEALAVIDQDAARPWIDIGLRPIRAETGGALDVEVTVSNSGEVEASDVRVSTWMLNAGSSDGEQALIDARSDGQVATVDVAPGAEQAVDTRVSLPEGTASPLLVAEARYPLPSGGEGRIAATFEIAVGDETPEARLHDVIERA